MIENLAINHWVQAVLAGITITVYVAVLFLFGMVAVEIVWFFIDRYHLKELKDKYYNERYDN